jgi:hypothetical protein
VPEVLAPCKELQPVFFKGKWEIVTRRMERPAILAVLYGQKLMQEFFVAVAYII